MTFSVTKSFLSTVVGLAVDRGLIGALNDPVADYGLPEHFASPHNAKITWDHLLSERWIGLARTPTPAEPTYGFMNYFLNTGGKLLPSAPEAAYHHLGAGTNMIYCDPVNDLVVVARWIERDAMDGLVKRVLAAITPAPASR